MSEAEHYTGELVEIPIMGSVEEMCKQICIESGLDKKEYHDTWKEMFEDEFHKVYIVIDDIIYKIETLENYSYAGIYLASRDGNGRIKFEVKYYNCSCSFGEAIKEAVKGMPK